MGKISSIATKYPCYEHMAVLAAQLSAVSMTLAKTCQGGFVSGGGGELTIHPVCILMCAISDFPCG